MKPFILWMTGLPCSGKTTIVKDLQKDIPNLAMLAKARKGEIKGFTGIDDPYEAPEKADLVIDTEHEPLSESANKVKDFLNERNLL